MKENTDTEVEQIKDEPRSYRELLLESGHNYRRFLYVFPALFFGLLSLVTISFIIHLHITELSFVTAAEQQSQNSVTDIPAMGLYISLVVYLASFLASIRGFVSRGASD